MCQPIPVMGIHDAHLKCDMGMGNGLKTTKRARCLPYVDGEMLKPNLAFSFSAVCTFGYPLLGFRTGTGKPAVLLKQVPQVRVQFDFWHTATHRVPVLRYRGYSRVYYSTVVLGFLF